MRVRYMESNVSFHFSLVRCSDFNWQLETREFSSRIRSQISIRRAHRNSSKKLGFDSEYKSVYVTWNKFRVLIQAIVPKEIRCKRVKYVPCCFWSMARSWRTLARETCPRVILRYQRSPRRKVWRGIDGGDARFNAHVTDTTELLSEIACPKMERNVTATGRNYDIKES